MNGPRTFKVLESLSTDWWIVNEKWIEDSAEQGKFLPEEDYEVDRYLKKAKRLEPSTIFEDVKIFVHPEVKCEPLTLSQLIHLIKLNGGTLSEFKDCSHAIVNEKLEGEEKVTLDYAFEVQESNLMFWKSTINYDKKNVAFVEWKWILNSIEKWRLEDIAEYQF